MDWYNGVSGPCLELLVVITGDAKRFIGRQFNDSSVQNDMKRWRFKVIDRNGKPYVEFTQNRVITVPAAFDQRQRAETMEAAKLAGLNVLKLVNEPTAAAVAFGMREKGNKTVLIYDFGGGTFDVSILKCQDGGHFEILSSAGHMHIGGQDIDNIIVNYAIEEYNKSHPNKFPEDKPKFMRRLNEACTKAKIELSGQIKSTMISVDLANDQDWKVDLNKAKFNEMIQSTIAGTLKIVDQALSRASLKTQDIDYVILAGGSTRIQLVREMLTEKFSKEKIWCKINPDEAVAIGASLIASSMQRDTPISLKLNIQEKTPLSLGVDYRHDYFAVVIPRGTVYPCKLDRVGGTSVDNQKEAEMTIYEGERKKASSNRKIGRVNLILENQNAKSSYKIKNIFEIDGNGILHVTTVEVDTENSANLEIQYDGLSYKEDDIQRVLAEAEAHKEEDADFESKLNSLKILEELLEQLNELKTMVQ
ncbi:hypothetical protein WR25_24635 [Diploscapter pachys]|uniref:Uncharacterized protein n=1 Tax=Diploscapter pachys TaxID=2018661 RepID=A0A2A2JZX7_9BILA|nr:hypothetical protein WR25_24635 [Diploscapter pachys]